MAAGAQDDGPTTTHDRAVPAKDGWYLKTGQAETLGQLTAYELKRYLGELRDRDLADNTIHGFFEVLRAFASWANRERYLVDPALLRVRAAQGCPEGG